MISMLPGEKKVSSVTLIISVAMHAVLIGGAGVPFDRDFSEMPEDEHSVIIQIEKPPLLPEIDIMSDEKKLMEVLEVNEAQSEVEIVEEPEDACDNPNVEDIATEDNSPVEICNNNDITEALKKDEMQEVRSDEKIDIPEPDNEAMLRYQDMVKQRIESRRRYPSWARRQKMEGVSYVVFTLLPDGRSDNIQLARSSGYSILDEEALSTIKRASPFDPIPRYFGSDSIVIELEIVFKL